MAHVIQLACRIRLELQWITPDDGQRNCPKHLEFRTRINVEISAAVGFIVKKFVTMHGHMNLKYNTALHLKLDEGVCAYSATYVVSTTLQLTRRKERLNVMQIYTSHESWPGKECIILSKYFGLSIALITLFHAVDRLFL